MRYGKAGRREMAAAATTNTTIAALDDHLDLARMCTSERMTAHKIKENI